MNKIIEEKAASHAIQYKKFMPTEFLDWFYSKPLEWQKIYETERIPVLNNWRWHEINAARSLKSTWEPEKRSPHVTFLLKQLFTREVGEVRRWVEKPQRYYNRDKIEKVPTFAKQLEEIEKQYGNIDDTWESYYGGVGTGTRAYICDDVWIWPCGKTSEFCGCKLCTALVKAGF